MTSIRDLILIHGDGNWMIGRKRLRDGQAIKIPARAGYMALTVESIGQGPRDCDAISVSHHYIQNGDVMWDPMMDWELGSDWTDVSLWSPLAFEMSNPPIRRVCAWQIAGPDYTKRLATIPAWIKDNKSFARIWNRNIREQGFVRAYKAIRQAQVEGAKS